MQVVALDDQVAAARLARARLRRNGAGGTESRGGGSPPRFSQSNRVSASIYLAEYTGSHKTSSPLLVARQPVGEADESRQRGFYFIVRQG